MSIINLDCIDVQTFSLYVSFLAVVASFLGLYNSWKVARFQIRSSVSQKWINELSAQIIEYVSECEGVVILGNDGILNSHSLNETLFKRLLYLNLKIELMLNPKMLSHAELIEITRSISDDVYHGVDDHINFGGRIRGVIEVSRKIISDELKKVSG
jgi:hypothetical protein